MTIFAAACITRSRTPGIDSAGRSSEPGFGMNTGAPAARAGPACGGPPRARRAAWPRHGARPTRRCAGRCRPRHGWRTPAATPAPAHPCGGPCPGARGSGAGIGLWPRGRAFVAVLGPVVSGGDAVNGAMLAVRGRPALLDSLDQPGGAVGDDQHRRAKPAGMRNLLAKLPEPQRERVRRTSWRALDEAINDRDGKQRTPGPGRPARRCRIHRRGEVSGDDLDALVVHLRYPTRDRRRWGSTNLVERSLGEVTDVRRPSTVACGCRSAGTMTGRGRAGGCWATRGRARTRHPGRAEPSIFPFQRGVRGGMRMCRARCWASVRRNSKLVA
jgi:hypothetical protein